MQRRPATATATTSPENTSERILRVKSELESCPSPSQAETQVIGMTFFQSVESANYISCYFISYLFILYII